MYHQLLHRDRVERMDYLSGFGKQWSSNTLNMTASVFEGQFVANNARLTHRVILVHLHVGLHNMVKVQGAGIGISCCHQDTCHNTDTEVFSLRAKGHQLKPSPQQIRMMPPLWRKHFISDLQLKHRRNK